MSEQKFTPWFPGSMLPERIGVFQTMEDANQKEYFYSYFNGKHFMHRSTCGAQSAADFKNSSSIYGVRPWAWRGLANPPQEKKP